MVDDDLKPLFFIYQFLLVPCLAEIILIVLMRPSFSLFQTILRWATKQFKLLYYIEICIIIRLKVCNVTVSFISTSMIYANCLVNLKF